MMRLRRRHNLRFIVSLSIMIMLVLFIILIVQFNQIENTSDKRLRKPILNRNEKEQFLNRYERLKGNSRLQIRNPKRFGDTGLMDSQDNYVENEQIEIDSKLMQKTMNSMQRIVHLDLKGSPPKVNYLKELIPFIKNAGATGVLIEYEDFFPYSSDLESIPNQNHYTHQELNQIIKLLKDSQLTVIPLIQTFGHLEFVLKLKQFAHLRETKEHFNVISPCLNDTYDKVLYKMIDQIIDSHPEDLEYIHIGCDEVYFINMNEACKSLEFLNTKQDFFIYHVTRLVDYIKQKRPSLSVMIWDDMLRKNIKMNKKLFKFAKKIIPMVWDYNEDVSVKIGTTTLKNYDRLFSEIWVASAFKGATHQLEIIPNANKHYTNHLSWLSTITKFSSPQKIKGIALTGWSRYDHMQAVCEILPAGLPSLVLCLQTLINYDKSDEIIMLKTKELTKCTYNKSEAGFILDPTTLKSLTLNQYDCDFPASNVYKWLLNLKTIIQYFENKHSVYSNILNSYNLKNNFFNTMTYVQATQQFYPTIKSSLKGMLDSGESQFDKYFYADLFEEISNVHILRYIEMIDARLLELNKTKMPENAPVRPINKISQSLV